MMINHGGLVGRRVPAEASEASVDVGLDDTRAQQGLRQLEDEAGVERGVEVEVTPVGRQGCAGADGDAVPDEDPKAPIL